MDMSKEGIDKLEDEIQLTDYLPNRWDPNTVNENKQLFEFLTKNTIKHDIIKKRI